MLDTGLARGVMHYAGLGPHEAWTLTTRKGRMDSIWRLFSERLPNFQQSVFFIGRDHFLIKRSEFYSLENWITEGHIDRFLRGKSITGTRLAQIVSCIDTIVFALHNREVRVFNNMFLFEIMSQDYFDELKARNEEKMEGLYANKHGFCRIPHQKHACKMRKDDRCIFAETGLVSDGINASSKRYYCGKFNSRFASGRLSLLASREIAGTVGSCENLRGFEI
ncbi:MAG: hypothetical protein ACD_15C00137G0024 [uncultured bacterium]|nr:MAG: hypothetical protein ACD_15C00137G0024 [uncultured bacterium]